MKRLLAALAVALGAAPAAAQSEEEEAPVVIEEGEGDVHVHPKAGAREPDTDIDVIVEQPDTPPTVVVVEPQRWNPGISFTAGGGIFGFSDDEARDLTTEVGPTYGARIHIGTRKALSFEVGYIGSAQDLNALGVEGDALLVSNGVDGTLRISMVEDNLRPYFMTGAAWKHYSVERTPVRTSSVRRGDDVFEVPVGGGVAYYFGGVVLDLRGAYRFAMDENLLRGPDDTELDNWDLTIRAGLEL